MLHELVGDAGERSPDELLARYRGALADVVEDVGTERVAAASGLSRERVEAVGEGEPVELTLAEAGAVLAAADGSADGDAIAAEARDHLLMGMTTAVLDVDAVAASLDADLSATGIQQRLEGRAETTLAEYARLRAFIGSRQR